MSATSDAIAALRRDRAHWAGQVQECDKAIALLEALERDALEYAQRVVAGRGTESGHGAK